MNQEIAQKIAERIEAKENGNLIITEEGKKIEIKKENYAEIPLAEDKDILFIDGGNAEIANASDFCVQKIRIFARIIGLFQCVHSAAFLWPDLIKIIIMVEITAKVVRDKKGMVTKPKNKAWISEQGP